MRKHDVRKWLHAVLDLLPVILIPVFMIYSHRHDVSSTSTYTEDVPVYYESNEVSSNGDILSNRIYKWTDNYVVSGVTNYQTIMTLAYNSISDIYTRMVIGPNILYLTNNNNDSYTIMNREIYFVPTNIYQQYLPTDFYEHVEDTDLQVISGYTQVTYDFEKDVMGAFMNNFNFTIDKYFNMGNVFNLNGVYEWFNTNIFSGNAPTVIYSIWNIALYELVMDLLFLLYGLFMWFIDMIQKLMEKPLDSVK